MRRLHQALLLALLLVAIQTTILAHGHEDRATSGAAAQSCEFCAGHQSAAPAPEPGQRTRPDLRLILVADLQVVAALPARASAAHRSRAPPAFRSV